MNKINLGVFSELSNNKADRDLRNVDLNKTDIIIEYQEPTVENDYTWYRLYASGWCEQGGISGWKVTITLPIKMQDTNYCVQISGNMTNSSTLGYPVDATNKTVSDFYLGTRDTGTQEVAWQVSGKANMAGHEIIPSKAEQESTLQKIIEAMQPDYSRIVNLSTVLNSTYTCPCAGYLYIATYSYDQDAFLSYTSSINTARQHHHYSVHEAPAVDGVQAAMFPVQKGEVLTCSLSSAYQKTASFIPLKGAIIEE